MRHCSVACWKFATSSIGNKKGPTESNKANPTATLSKDDIKAIKERMVKGKQADAVVIRASELARIKDSTKVIGKRQEAEERKRLEMEKEKEREASEALKRKMKEFDQTRTKKLPLTIYQKEANEKNVAILSKAEKAVEEDMDDVKHMNKMVHYAKCATVRDRQLEEAKEIEKQQKEVDERVDIVMEIERLKTLKYYDERENVKKETRRQGALVIVDQMKERQGQRKKEEELKMEEQKKMLEHIVELQKEEIKQQEDKVIRAQQLMEVVKDANRKAIEIKQKKTAEEKEVDKKISEYNVAKAAREEAYLKEQQRIHDEKEKEVQSLREKQLKAINKQSDIDELKARRAFEESERQIREKERKECEDRVRDCNAISVG